MILGLLGFLAEMPLWFSEFVSAYEMIQWLGVKIGYSIIRWLILKMDYNLSICGPGLSFFDPIPNETGSR